MMPIRRRSSSRFSPTFTLPALMPCLAKKACIKGAQRFVTQIHTNIAGIAFDISGRSAERLPERLMIGFSLRSHSAILIAAIAPVTVPRLLPLKT